MELNSLENSKWADCGAVLIETKSIGLYKDVGVDGERNLYEVSGAIDIFVIIIIIVNHSLKNKGQDFSKAAKVMPDKVIGVTKHWGHIIVFIQNSHCQDLLEKKIDLTDDKCEQIIVF